METTDPAARRAIFSVMTAQLLVTALLAAGFLTVRGHWLEALAAVYGGGVALAATGWYWRGLVRSARAEAGVVRQVLMGGAIQRFAFVAAAFAAGMGMLALSPVPLLAAYAGSQLGYLLAAFIPTSQRIEKL
jgi:hypothetical protein